MSARPLVHDHLSTLAEPTRGRVLLTLESQELTVSELCSVLRLPQSTVSRHLRVLGDEEWIVSRQEGTSRYYALSPGLDGGARRLWEVVRDDLRDSRAAVQDRQRLERVRDGRSAKSRAFFAKSASRWDSMRAELYGDRADLIALFGLLNDQWVVGDLGCGTGRLSEVLAPYVSRVVAVDASPEMLSGARLRLAPYQNVDLRGGELEALPIDSASLDAAVLSLVLHHTVDPVRVLAEAQRVVRAGGRLLIVDMLPHDHEEYRQQMGHVWLGFAEGQVQEWLHDTGFTSAIIRRLTADSAAKGPALFAASARRT